MPHELRPNYLALNEEADIISCMYIKEGGCFKGYREDLREVVGFALASCDEYRNDSNYEGCLRQQLGDDLRGLDDNCVIDIVRQFWRGECNIPPPKETVKPDTTPPSIQPNIDEPSVARTDIVDEEKEAEPLDANSVKIHTSNVSFGEYDVPLSNRKTGTLDVDIDKNGNPICILTYERTSLTDLGCDGVDKIVDGKKKTAFSKLTDDADKDSYNGVMESALDIVAPGIKLPRYRSQTRATSYSNPGTYKKIRNEVNFPTAQSNLDERDKKALDEFAAGYQGGEIVIEGYTDPRGGTSYNFELGKKRALAAKAYLSKVLKKSGKPCNDITTISFGEMGATGKDMASERRAVITGGTTLIERALESSNAAISQQDVRTYYLIDASGSMFSNWNAITNYRYSPNTVIYSFNTCIGILRGLPRNPDCFTPLWNSMYNMLNNTVDRKGRMVVLTDGLDNNSLDHNYRDIISLAKKKGVTISTIYIGNYHEGENHLAEIALKTGGFFYLKAE